MNIELQFTSIIVKSRQLSKGDSKQVKNFLLVTKLSVLLSSNRADFNTLKVNNCNYIIILIPVCMFIIFIQFLVNFYYIEKAHDFPRL